MQDTSVFLDFATFYHCFIQDFNKITNLLTLMLKIAKSSKNLLTLVNMIEKNAIVDESVFRVTKLILSRSKMTKLAKLTNLTNLFKFWRSGKTFLTSKAKIAFIWLSQAFTKALVF